MSKEFISVNLNITIGDTIDILREMMPDEEVMYYIYITDEEDNIEGVVPLKDLILYPPETKIKEIMDTTVSRVKHENEKLVGIVIIHDLVDEFLYPLWKKKN